MPFSFFGWVILPDPNGVQTPDNQTDVRLMLAHEQVHARQWHSADVLLLELLSVLLWWHPLVHWYRNALRTVHEYAADAAVARQFSLKQYGLLLIRHVQSGPAPALVHHFFQSPIKQRITMLTQQVSSPLRAWKYVAVLPVLALLFSFNTTSAQQSAGASASSGGGSSAGKGASASATTPCDSMPQFAGGFGALGKFLATNLKYPETARKAKAEQLVILQLTIGTDGLVTEAIGVPGKTFRDDLLTEAIRVARLTSWQPAQCNGQTFKAKVTLPIRFKLD
jgi:TonB family protein